MSTQIQNINLVDKDILAFFEQIIKSGVELKDCNQYLSDLLERCSNEKCLENLFPAISNVAQRIHDANIERMPKNFMTQSIH